MTAPEVHSDRIRFMIDDDHNRIASARLHQEIARPRNGPEFVRLANTRRFEALIPRPDADRMEYEFEISLVDGGREIICDPSNPLRAGGPFGEKSVLEFPGYAAPEWLRHVPSDEPQLLHTEIRCRAIRRKLPIILWAPEDTAPYDPLPLLIAHDGPEYALYSRLLDLIRLSVSEQRLPGLRVALLQPLARDDIYSASAAYARALVHEILPALAEIAPTPHGRLMRVGMGASLGALALLHAHRSAPEAFGALFLQSGSFFRQRFDPQERDFPRFGRISRFAGQVLRTPDWTQPIPIGMTCGSAEENLLNNTAMAEALVRQGYEVSFHINRDAHNWTAWRDTFDPHLINLLNKMWA